MSDAFSEAADTIRVSRALPAERRELEPEEVRRLVPIVFDMIRDDLNPPEFQRGVRQKALDECRSVRDLSNLITVQTLVGKALAQAFAHGENKRELGGDDALPGPHTPHSILERVEAGLLAHFPDA